MRLIFSNSYYKNTDISDEQGNKLYTISTPRGWKQVTTITKYDSGKRNRAPQVLCVIEWHRVKKTKFLFGQREMAVDRILYRRPYSWGRYFTGPDGLTYKWKVGFRYCWVMSSLPVVWAHLNPRSWDLLTCYALFFYASSNTKRNTQEHILSSFTDGTLASENRRILRFLRSHPR
ncbi:hypothetical protein L210DRAFT_3550062 [Boletus edulis BED1]|uniref:DUF6593 domain-containing protein n=1 Tax=Boletus edulis BED1 TaxID=1328754 RepID=A0AAD4BPR6_BOLED|nr:hypothetical protein L210DRAFT_3550062 [Boletus edulis BED1]